MRILVSNDDGVTAPGITILANALKQLAEVIVVAPDRNCSAASHSLTINNPLRTHEHENGFVSVNGTPTDSVHLAITGFLTELPDMVVSGINDGANLGDDVIYSGTVAAAIEGRYLGLPALAVSLVGKKHYQTAAHVTKQIIMRLENFPLPKDTILNINVPDVPVSELKGCEVTRLGTRDHAGRMYKEKDPRGQVIYWVGLPGEELDAGPGTDFQAIAQNKVSITPLQLDLTNYSTFDNVAKWTVGLLD